MSSLLSALLGFCASAALASPSPASLEPDPQPGEGPDSNYQVDFWRLEQGLPNNTVNALLQTRDGYLWLGTAAGLARFDGSVFTVIGDETAPPLKNAHITALLEDRDGGLWIGTQKNGLVRLLRGQAEIFGTSRGLASDSITSLAEDATRTVWIGTQAGLNRWDKGRLTRFITPGLPGTENVVALHAGRSGALWITTRSGLFRLRNGAVLPFEPGELAQGRNAEFIGAYEDRAGNIWAFGSTFLLNVTQGQSLNNFPSFNLSSSRVWTISEQNDGAFWIGTSVRLFRFQNGRFEVAAAREGLEQCDVRALYSDQAGNLWIGTSGDGLARLRTRRLTVVGSRQGLNARVSTVVSAGSGAFWIGTTDDGLWRWDGRRAERFEAGPPLDAVTQIHSLCVDQDGGLWVGTWGAGLIQYFQGRSRVLTMADGLSDNIVKAIVPDPAGQGVWVGTPAGKLHRVNGANIRTFSAADGLAGGPITALYVAGNGPLLIGSENGGVVQRQAERFSRVPLPAEIESHPVRCFFEDRKRRVWVGTDGAGAFCRAGETWTALSRAQGLPSGQVLQMAQDDAGDYWFGTEHGFHKAAEAGIEDLIAGQQRLVAFTPGLAGSGFDGARCAPGWPTVARGTNDVTWLATTDGVIALEVSDRVGPQPPPPVVLERVRVNGQAVRVAYGSPLTLPPGTKSLDLEFTAINFSPQQKVVFRHKLENFDADWVQSDVGRRAHYGPLPPGNYEFRVTAAIASDGVWSELGARLDVVAQPPLWRAWWFLTLAAILGVGAIFAIARFIALRRLRARLRAAEQRHAMERERARIAQDMHDEIGSKLTRISFLSEVARQAGAEGSAPPVEAIANTSRELLQSLDEIVWAVNPRNDNLEQLAGYLEQHAREYFQATDLECVIQVPPELPHVRLTAEVRHNVFLAFGEALNNALKHAQARRVTIVMSLGHHEFQVQIQDDGKGFEPGEPLLPEQDGLSNIESRLAAAGGSCSISSQPGAGTTLTLRFTLPVRKPRHTPAEPPPHSQADRKTDNQKAGKSGRSRPPSLPCSTK